MYKPGLKIHPRCMAQKAHLFHLAAPHGTRCCVCSSASKTMPRALKSLGFLARKKKQRKTPKGWAAPPTLFHIYFNSTCIWMLFDWFEITCLTSAMTTIISLHRHLRRSAWHYLILSLSLSISPHRHLHWWDWPRGSACLPNLQYSIYYCHVGAQLLVAPQLIGNPGMWN